MRKSLLFICSTLLAGLSLPTHAATHPDNEDIQRVLTRHQLPADTLALVALPLRPGTKAITYNADAPVNPASVMKLVTTYAALDTLGQPIPGKPTCSPMAKSWAIPCMAIYIFAAAEIPN